MNESAIHAVTLKQVQAFIAVASSLSFAKASQELNISQPALSIALKNLEQALGGDLLQRTTRSLQLTPEGEQFLPIAQRFMASWRSAITDIQQQFSLSTGQLSLASMPSYAAAQLPSALLAFRNEFPGIRVGVQDVVAEQVERLVAKGEVELGISFRPAQSAPLDFVPLFEDAFVLVVAPSHPLASNKAVSWKDIHDEAFVLLHHPSSMRRQIEQALPGKVNLAFETHQLVTVGAMVAKGLGVSIVPSLCKRMMAKEGAICVPMTDPSIIREVGILTRPGDSLSASARAFVTLLKEL